MELQKLKSYQQILLNQLYSQRLQKNEEEIKIWTQYKDKHKKIIEGLQILVIELSLNCIVPLGKRALMKGKLKHTNEILVCIGDGYFAKYSAQQAISLCERRIKRSEEMLQKLEQEKNLFEIREMLPLDYGAFEFGDCKDLIEYWDDKKLDDWKVQHRKREQEYRQQLLKLKCTKKKEIITEDDLFQRLDELELEEELADELNRLEDEYKNFHSQGILQDEVYDDFNEDSNTDESEEEVKDQEDLRSREPIFENLDNATLNSDQKKQKKIEIIKNDKIAMIAQNTSPKAEISCTKDTRVNGKFEVSIIKEEEVQKMLRKSTSLSSCDNFENLDAVLPNKKLKGSTRRVSFAEPNLIEMEPSDQNEDFKDEIIENDDIININFVHSITDPIIPEGSVNNIISPKDIYEIFCKPKSILKKSLDRCQTNLNLDISNCSIPEESVESDNTTKSAYNIVVQDIQERKLGKTITEPSELIKKNRPVSRFKLERANIKK